MESNLPRKDEKPLLKMSVQQLTHPIWFLPTFGFLCCVGISLVNDFEASTATHCHVRNYLPSISSAIGGYTPQRWIFRICIGLHSWPRLLMAFLMYSHYTSFQNSHRSGIFKLLLRLSLTMNIVENLCLVVLSMVSSTEHYKIHESSFIIFIVCSISYMLLTCTLFKWSRSPGPMNKQDVKSFKYKTSIFTFYVFTLIIAGYLFWRHNAYCEQGIYSLFSLCEYLIVLSNVAFHTFEMFHDFPASTLCFQLPDTCRWTSHEKLH